MSLKEKKGKLPKKKAHGEMLSYGVCLHYISLTSGRCCGTFAGSESAPSPAATRRRVACWSASLRVSTKTSPTNLRPPRLTETNGDNWQEAVQRYITASAGGRARPPLLLKAIPPLSLCKLPPNPLLSDLAVILLFLPILSPASSDTSRSGPLPLVVLESARPERREK